MLTTDRLILRDFEEDDWQTVFAMAQEPAITRYQSLLRLETEEAARQWVNDGIFYNNERPRHAYNLLITERDGSRSLGWIGWGEADDPAKGDYNFG